jgi:hypothetical protein
MQPYEPRAFCFDELRVLHKCDIKLHGLARRGEFPRTELLAGGKRSRRPARASKFSKADPGGVSWFYFAAKLLWRLSNPIGPRTTDFRAASPPASIFITFLSEPSVRLLVDAR